MKLKSVLKALSVESLRKIMGFWGVQPPEGVDFEFAVTLDDLPIEYLYPRLQQRPHFDLAHGKLSEAERELVSFLAMHGGDLEKAEVLERLYAGDEDKMDQLVRRLSERGFVFYDKMTEEPDSPLMVGVPEPYLRFIDLPAYWEGYLGYFLRNLPNEQLRFLATHGLKLPIQSIRKDFLLNSLRNYLLTPRTLRQHIDRLTEDQRSLFQVLVECKGTCLYRDLLEIGFQKRSDHSKADHINTLLQTSGLVFTAVPGANKYSSLLMIPRDIYWIVTHHFQPDRRSLRQLDTVSVIEKEKGPGIILENTNTVLRDLVIFAAQVNRLNVRPLANGGIGKNDLKKILPKLSAHKSLKYCLFLAAFLIHRKYLVSTGDVFHVSSQFLQLLEDSRQLYEQLMLWWVDTAEWNEEFVEGDVSHTDMPPGNLVSIAEFRRIVIRHLLELPANRWCNFDGFAEALGPQIEAQIPRRGVLAQPDRHNRSNELVTESILAETLMWLGLISLGLKSIQDLELIGMRTGNGRTGPHSGRRGRPRKQKYATFVFQLTDIGRTLLTRLSEGQTTLIPRKTDTEEDTLSPFHGNTHEFIVQPNLEVLAPPNLNLKAFYNLNEFADIRSVDVMSTLQISRESLRSGMDHGVHAEDILQFLKSTTRGRIPEAVMNLVTETSDKHGEVNMGYAGGYIIVDDPMLLEEIKANKRLVRAIKDIVDNRLVLLNPDVNVRKLAKELQKIGFMPRLASEHVHIVSEDSYHLSLSKEDMYTLFAALRFIAAIEEDLSTNVTEDKVSPLIERLKPDPKIFYALSFLAESLTKTWVKNYEEATRARIEELKTKYKSHLSKIVTAAQPRRATKYSFEGPNPATEKSDVTKMIQFGIENEFQMEIQYVRADGNEIIEIIQPESLEHEKVYAHCKTRNTYAVYRLDRVLRSRLV
jgi:hypothetical protein